MVSSLDKVVEVEVVRSDLTLDVFLKIDPRRICLLIHWLWSVREREWNMTSEFLA